MAEYNFNDIDEILTSPTEPSGSDKSSSQPTSKKIKGSPKSVGVGEYIQALNAEGKGKYIGIPAGIAVGAYGTKARYAKQYLATMKDIARLRGEERNLVEIAKGSRTTQGIASGGSAIKATPMSGDARFLTGNAKPLTEMTSAEIASVARTESARRTAFAGSSLKGYVPSVTAESAELPNTFTKYMQKGGQLVEAYTPPVVKEVAGKAGKYLKVGGRTLAGLVDIPKLANTGNVYDYYTNNERRGVDPNSWEYKYVAPIGGAMKAIQNVGEVANDIRTEGMSILGRDVILPYLLNKNTNDKEQELKASLIEQYVGNGMNPIQAEKLAKNYLNAQRTKPELTDEEYKKQNYGIDRKTVQALGDSFSNFILSSVNAETPPE